MRRMLIVVLIFATACSTEPEFGNYDVEILNNANVELTIESYLDNSLIETISLLPNQSGLNCEYSEEAFIGYLLLECNFDQVIFKFNNGKGYISDVNVISGFDFPNETGIFGPSEKFIQNEDGIYQFIITQQDFDNAFDLP